MQTAARMDGVAWIMLVGLALVWGFSFPFAQIALTELPVLPTLQRSGTGFGGLAAQGEQGNMALSICSKVLIGNSA